MYKIDSKQHLGTGFLACPEEWREEKLALIERVRERHLHVEDPELWATIRFWITNSLASGFVNEQWRQHKAKKKVQALALPQLGTPVQVQPTGQTSKREQKSQFAIRMPQYCDYMGDVNSDLMSTFHDPDFTSEVMEALHRHLMTPLSHNTELIYYVLRWVSVNAMYLPLGEHLLDAYVKDMKGESAFAQSVMLWHDFVRIEEACSKGAIDCMRRFLAAVDQANRRTQPDEDTEEGKQPVAVILDLKHGAGGHTAPAKAMMAQLKERGWRVVEIRYDCDLDAESDVLSSLGVTFADGTPMTDSLYQTRWNMPQRELEAARIVRLYAQAMQQMHPELFSDKQGGELLRKQILKLRPELFVTTLAYHWIWGSLAYRIPTAKTLLVASDVFFHREAALVWQRQRDLDPKLRQLHFGVMTDEVDILSSLVPVHDTYFQQKHPSHELSSLAPVYNGFSVDAQVSVIGTPINPAFKVITAEKELARLREKWELPKGALSVCLSRGRMGYTEDIVDGLEGYRGTTPLARKVVIQVVCGENDVYLRELNEKGFEGLAPGISLMPRPLLSPSDFAELRAISTIDDIKAGGGTTMEGWYLISQGSPTMLVMTPGPELFWEGCNCLAMDKWGIGRYVGTGENKLSILDDVISNGLPKVTNPMPDWRPAFDETVKRICGEL